MRVELRAHVFLIQPATQQAKRVSFCNWFNCTPKTLCTEILVEPWQFVYCSLVSTSENKLLVLVLANYARRHPFGPIARFVAPLSVIHYPVSTI